MSELHLPRKTMAQLDRSFWESIETERAHYLSDQPPQPAARPPETRPQDCRTTE